MTRARCISPARSVSQWSACLRQDSPTERFRRASDRRAYSSSVAGGHRRGHDAARDRRARRNFLAMIDVPSPLGRVCVVMMSAVGDAVHVLPVINALKRHSPGVHITWVLQPAPATLVRGHRSIDEILIFDRSMGFAAFTDIRHSSPDTVRSRPQSPGVLQGRRRDAVHARAREVGIRSRPRARRELAVHNAPHSAARRCSTCRISISNSSLRSALSTSRWSGIWVRGRTSGLAA